MNNEYVVLLISRPLRAKWRKIEDVAASCKSEPPNRRVRAAYEIARRVHGRKRPRLSSIDKYYNSEGGCEIFLDADTREPLDFE